MSYFVNYYECPRCLTAWSSRDDCTCNDRCPDCNDEIEPYNSEEIPIRDFASISQEDFDMILHDLVVRDAHQLLTIPIAYEVFSEHYNNEVLSIYERDGRPPLPPPLTGEEAEQLFQCSACAAGSPACDGDCVLSATCSVRCPGCSRIIYFQGDLHNSPKYYICPYCRQKQFNKYSDR